MNHKTHTNPQTWHTQEVNPITITETPNGITDSSTGLEWYGKLEGLPRMNWHEAHEFCESHLGDRWRMPTAMELIIICSHIIGCDLTDRQENLSKGMVYSKAQEIRDRYNIPESIWSKNTSCVIDNICMPIYGLKADIYWSIDNPAIYSSQYAKDRVKVIDLLNLEHLNSAIKSNHHHIWPVRKYHAS